MPQKLGINGEGLLLPYVTQGTKRIKYVSDVLIGLNSPSFHFLNIYTWIAAGVSGSYITFSS